tara:strand:+ start:2204 stop:2359 length:156 start_codon:yes stop_codon:yes gene_type:complete
MNAQTSLVNELEDLLESYNGLISYTELIGVLEVLKFDLMNEMLEQERLKDE